MHTDGNARQAHGDCTNTVSQQDVVWKMHTDANARQAHGDCTKTVSQQDVVWKMHTDGNARQAHGDCTNTVRESVRVCAESRLTKKSLPTQGN